MREFLTRISPVNNAAKIARPLFVAHGRNDPRVPYTEAEPIIETVRRNGTAVWYLLADSEGHGSAKKENFDFYFYATIRFELTHFTLDCGFDQRGLPRVRDGHANARQSLAHRARTTPCRRPTSPRVDP